MYPDTARAIEAAAAAFKGWSRTTLEERKGYLQVIQKEYMSRQKDVAANLQQELGAPKVFAEKVQSNMFNMHWGATLAMAGPGAFEWTVDMGDTLLVKEPIGVVGCITPWNWPLNQIACKIAPALLAGRHRHHYHHQNTTTATIIIANATRHHHPSPWPP